MKHEFGDPILTVAEVATYLSISKAKTYYLIQRDQLPHIRIQRNVRVRHSDLLKWIEELRRGNSKN
jgi:excisionase family DNA binding protein